MFDTEIIFAIWLTRALERSDFPSYNHVNDRIIVDYLWLRTKSDHTHSHGLTTLVENTVELLERTTLETLPPKDSLLREACSAFVQANDPLMSHSDRILKHTPRDCSPAENLLALAAQLGQASVVQKLLEEGVQEVQSDFGYASHRIVLHRNPQLTSTYLQTKLDLSLKEAKGSTPDCFVRDDSRFHICDTMRSRRGISFHRYERLIWDTTAHGVLEVVQCLVDALCADEGDFQKCRHHRHFRAPGLGPNPSNDLRTAAQNFILATAATFGRFDMAQAALDNGADPNWNSKNAPPSWCESILGITALKGHHRIFELLVRYGADLWWRRCNPLLVYAITGRSLGIIEFCLRSGMTTFPRSTSEGRMRFIHPLAAALRPDKFKTCHDILRLLWKHGITFEPESQLDQRLCEIASSHGDSGSLALLAEIRGEQRIFASWQGRQ